MRIKNKTRVLVIEDDDVDRESIHQFVGDEFHLMYSEEGLLGLEEAKQVNPDCIVLDYRLPDIDGLALLPELLAENIPVVMLTSSGNESVAVEAMKLGAIDYIPKASLTSLRLKMAIQQAVDTIAMQRKIAEQQEDMKSFISVASHDLRAPLRHVGRFCELARRESQGVVSSEIEGYLDRAVNCCKRMQDLLDSLVTFARCGRSEIELVPVSLNQVAEQAIANLSVEIDETNAKIDTGELSSVLGHEPSLIELFQNLIGNAIKYSGDHAPAVVLRTSFSEGELTLSVRDNGIGISEEYHAQVFEPFRRLHGHAAIEGSGIGLACCKRIVDHHRGRIWVESKTGHGSTFFITLQPFSEAPATLGDLPSTEANCSLSQGLNSRDLDDEGHSHISFLPSFHRSESV